MFRLQKLSDFMENGYTKPTNAQDIVGFTQVQRYELREN
jgi:hypothetical protein